MEEVKNSEYTKAQFWRCALQVNPGGYMETFRGQTHGMNESDYNAELLRIASENNIEVIGLADHGNVDGIDTLRQLLTEHGIVVFPGFEITSTEKVHFVCLFPETTTKTQLNRYLGALGLTDPDTGVWPSRLGGSALLEKVDELGGMTYAAHCTEDNGILQRKIGHVWVDPLLKAAQIPGRLEELRNEQGNGYRRILTNKDPAYQREVPLAIINAKDVAVPTDLSDLRTSCLIKMTKPCFDSFKLAFLDPESRVRLNSDVSEQHYSRIEHVKITGGYLDGLDIDFSEHLNAVIGGRGTGKSTLIECIRYALDLPAIGASAQKQHDQIVKENLGKSKARIELVVRSSRMNGARFKVARRYGEVASVTDEQGKPSAFNPRDLLPEVEIYGQNEILEIAQNVSSQRQLIGRFLQDKSENKLQELDLQIQKLMTMLKQNSSKLVRAHEEIAGLEDEVARLPKLEEQERQFKALGLEKKLDVIPLLETEKRLLKRATEQEVKQLDDAFQEIRHKLPGTRFLDDKAIENLPHSDKFRELREALTNVRSEAQSLLSGWSLKYTQIKETLESLGRQISDDIKQEESALDRLFKEIPTFENKSGTEIGIEYQKLMRQIQTIRPNQEILEEKQKQITSLWEERKSVSNDLSSVRASRSAELGRILKRLNKQLDGKLRLAVLPESDTSPVRDFLLQCNLDNVKSGRLGWLADANDFSPVKLAKLIREGEVSLLRANWGITPTVATGLAKLLFGEVLALEEVELPDTINIELNTAHDSQDNYRPIGKLSTGQQCTAILHLLLLKNLDPLIMDQPEDNLDNSFIAERIVSELRSAKVIRQFIFATHNANIPVFGDAEWIGVLESSLDQAYMPVEAQGAIDMPFVRNKAANILEGGKVAFNQRKTKYGF